MSTCLLGACASEPPMVAPTGATMEVTAPPPAAPATAVPRAAVTTPPPFTGTVTPVTAADLPSSWRPGCPVAPADLRMLRLAYVDFEGRSRTGSMVVHGSVADAVVGVFRRLYDAGFPIRRMEPIDVYGGSDEASTAAGNTSGFNCRNAVASGPPSWSAHAYGKAVDVNPVENPYVLGGRVLPPAGAAYLDRDDVRPGMAVRGSELTAAFAAAGWSWGGVWPSPDYQHFSATGG